MNTNDSAPLSVPHPPALPPQPQDTPAGAGGPGDHTRDPGPTPLDRALAQVHRLPRRDRHRATLGGVCAGLADRSGLAPVAVRAALVVLTLAGGAGIGLYLLAWTLMPDETGHSHLEQGLRFGRGRSVLVLALGSLAALGLVTGALAWLAGTLPQLIGLALLGAAGWWGYRAWSGRVSEPTRDS